MPSLLRPVLRCTSQHTHLRFYTVASKAESLARLAAQENQVRCVLANHPDFPAFHVTIDSIASVARLKKVIRAEKINELGHVNSSKLTLVRIFKTTDGRLTKNDLQKWNQPLNKATYGKDPENAKDEVSIFHRTRGACLEKDGMFFKVMHSKKKTRFYMNSSLDELYHVLVLLPHENNVLQISPLERYLGTAPKDSKSTPNSDVSGMDLESQAITCMEHIKWKDDVPIVSTRGHQKNSFVSGTRAVEDLQRIHLSNFLRATTGEAGADWVIPIAENEVEVGESEFCTHYIIESRKTTQNPLKHTLCSCHTVHVQFTTTQPLTEGSFNSTMIKYLKAALEPMFISPPSMLSNDYETVEDFLEDLTQVAGPVFIVLGGIENAFKGNDLKVRHQFLLFCRKILSHWFALPSVFFVVLGRACFINNVGRQPGDTPMRGTSFHFERLNQRS
ncbi:hypothetical protein HDU78_007195 [Chytriomyces hyalinus]|nr:hypothetical protein HDU78_007195 [Chytriomyces hyalinus]